MIAGVDMLLPANLPPTDLVLVSVRSKIEVADRVAE
jgi:hypothetical protein